MWYSVRENMQRFFKKYDLDITAKSNQKFVNYIEITFNLKEGTFRLYYCKKIQVLI